MKSAVPKVFESDLGHMQKVPPLYYSPSHVI